MSEKPKEVIVGGRKFLISKVGARTGNRIIFKLGQRFMQSLAQGFSSKSSDKVMAILMALLNSMSMEEYDWVTEEMQKVTQIGVVDEKGDKRVTLTGLDVDTHFRGHLMDAHEWLIEALKENFADFLGEAFARVEAWNASQDAVKKAASPSDPQTAPTASGSSGASSLATS